MILVILACNFSFQNCMSNYKLRCTESKLSNALWFQQKSRLLANLNLIENGWPWNNLQTLIFSTFYPWCFRILCLISGVNKWLQWVLGQNLLFKNSFSKPNTNWTSVFKNYISPEEFRFLNAKSVCKILGVEKKTLRANFPIWFLSGSFLYVLALECSAFVYLFQHGNALKMYRTENRTSGETFGIRIIGCQ